tara:strand:+ start:3035 stop:3394 length:360 start_codon:yes stop_codon:yes gene_type:complete
MTEQHDLLLNKQIIYTCLLLQEFAYRELLSSHHISGTNRHKISTKYRYIQNQLLQLKKESGVSKKVLDKSEDTLLNNVALIATIMGVLSIVPPCQIDFIEQEFERIMVEAMKRFNDGKN